MIYLDIKEQDLLDKDKVLGIANSIFLSKRITPLNYDESYDEKLKKCFDYYNGKEPLTTFSGKNTFKPRVFNLTKPICEIATQTFIGDLPNIVSTGGKKEQEKISVFNQKLYNAQFGVRINETAKMSSKCGTGMLALYNEMGDKFPRFREINPLYADCVYDCSLARKHLLSYYIVEHNEANTYGVPTTKLVMYVYTKKRIYSFITQTQMRLGNITVPNNTKQPLVPFMAWLFRDSSGVSKETNYVEHDFNDIPIIEFPNNAEYLGDAEPVFDLIAFYNDLINNRGKNVNDIVNYILYLKNIRVGDEKEQKEFINLLEEHHIIAVEGENVDAKFLSNPLNQEQLQLLQNSVKETIHYISRVPDLSSVDFSQNASDPIIKIKTKPLLDLCKQKEKSFTEPYLRVIKMVLEYCRKNDKQADNYLFDIDLCSLKYTHTLPSNDNDMITMITNLSNSGLANPSVLLEELSFVPNVHEYLKGMIKHNEYVDNRKKELQNIIKSNNGGTNETNIERQNAKPLTKDKMDNKHNFNNGNAKTLSDEKVE